MLPPDIRLIFDRGPFDEQAETALLTHEKIDVLVSKNSGGRATYAKIEAARKLGIPGRDDRASAQVARTCRGKCRGAPSTWLEQQLAHRATSCSARGV